MSKLSTILLHFAGFIIMMHSLVGHAHLLQAFNSQAYITSQEESEFQENWLQEFISLDLGEGHLDCFLISDNSFDFSDESVNRPIELEIAGNIQLNCQDHSTSFFEDDYSSSSKPKNLSFRGPPNRINKSI